MKKKKKTLLIIILLILILIAIIVMQRAAQQRDQEGNVPKQVSPTPEFEKIKTIHDPGYPTDQPDFSEEVTEQHRQITELKNITPVSTPNFTIEFSYKTGGFIVKSDLGLNATEKALEIWLNEKGFGNIESSRFEYQSNKLSL